MRKFVSLLATVLLIQSLAVWSTGHSAEPCLARQLRVVRTNFQYAAQDPSNVLFHTSGELSHDGTLKLFFQTRDEDTGVRSAYLRGKEQFAEIMNHFNSRIKRISAHWVYGDNLAEFNRLTGLPQLLSPAQAAAKTWTGRNAAEFNFREVRFKTLIGYPGEYEEVEVIFERSP